MCFSLNTIKNSQVWVYLHWCCNSPCAHVKGISSSIHPIMSCPQTIPCQYFDVLEDPCIHVKIQDVPIEGHKINIHLKHYILMQMEPLTSIIVFGIQLDVVTFKECSISTMNKCCCVLCLNHLLLNLSKLVRCFFFLIIIILFYFIFLFYNSLISKTFNTFYY
jgi:hypothetical protein